MAVSKLSAAVAAAVLCLALLAGRRGVAAQATNCSTPTWVVDCANQIQQGMNAVPVFAPACCNEFASEEPCLCALRAQLVNIGVDPKKVFCVNGAGCGQP